MSTIIIITPPPTKSTATGSEAQAAADALSAYEDAREALDRAAHDGANIRVIRTDDVA